MSSVDIARMEGRSHHLNFSLCRLMGYLASGLLRLFHLPSSERRARPTARYLSTWAIRFVSALAALALLGIAPVAAQTQSAPTVANALPDRPVTVGVALDYTFPEDTFSDADGDTLTYTATDTDGNTLPSWLTFDAATRNFSGTPPEANADSTVMVRVTAADGNGGTANADFVMNLLIPATVRLVYDETTVDEDNYLVGRLELSRAIAVPLRLRLDVTRESGDTAGVQDANYRGISPTIPAGETVWELTRDNNEAVYIRPDTTVEADETFTVLLLKPLNQDTFMEEDPADGVTLAGTTSHTITIRDADTARFMIEDAQVMSGASAIQFTVSRSLVDEHGLSTSVLLSADYKLRVRTMDGTATAGTDYTQADQELTFRHRFIAPGPETETQTFTVTLDPAQTRMTDGTFTVALSAGNNVGEAANYNVSFGPPATGTIDLPPILSTAAVDGTTLTLVYDDALDEDSVPATSAFMVIVDGGTPVSPSSVAIAGSTVTLTLAMAVTSGQTVTLAYTKPASNQITNTFGRDAPGFSGEAVTVPETDLCQRTSAVRDAILALATGNPTCSALTVMQLAAIAGTLDLADESLTALKDIDLGGLSGLTGLDLSGNSLTLQAGLFDDLAALTMLDVSDNQLAVLPDLSSLSALTDLDVSDNRLTALPDLSGLTALATLDVMNNPLSDLSALALTDGDDSAITLTPVFDGSTLRYEAETAAANVKLTATVADTGVLPSGVSASHPAPTVRFGHRGSSLTAVDSGTASTAIALVEGANFMEIQVNGRAVADGDTDPKTYSIRIQTPVTTPPPGHQQPGL